MEGPILDTWKYIKSNLNIDHIVVFCVTIRRRIDETFRPYLGVIHGVSVLLLWRWGWSGLGDPPLNTSSLTRLKMRGRVCLAKPPNSDKLDFIPFISSVVLDHMAHVTDECWDGTPYDSACYRRRSGCSGGPTNSMNIAVFFIILTLNCICSVWSYCQCPWLWSVHPKPRHVCCLQSLKYLWILLGIKKFTQTSQVEQWTAAASFLASFISHTIKLQFVYWNRLFVLKFY